MISITDFTQEEIEYILDKTDEIRKLSIERSDLLKGKVMAILFFEPSTRTRISFETAMKRLGGETVDMSEPKRASIEKGENLTDTVRVIDNYVDVIVIRHPLEGSARLAAEIAENPVINGGSGAEEHPTQALLDLYTIRREKERINGLTIAFVGDLKYSRTVHSLSVALANYNVKLYFISPPILKMRREILEYVSNKVSVEEVNDLNDVVEEVDVLYVTRIQKERFSDISDYMKVKGSYKITLDHVKKMREDAIIMHPLPRVDEIDYAVDQTPQAKYFKQVYYGLLVRMSLLALILGAVE
ncbi:aspartate carbamoyltransferase [Candidatus Bathyarchaeota archaeon]|nr:aspartate carbamoyltransferase [Candidatus Bathyarchaeota archaeon]MBS7617585.1 aspartate carbamoyltransferase [Candidatus Bathyarchaeota archaeon]